MTNMKSVCHICTKHWTVGFFWLIFRGGLGWGRVDKLIPSKLIGRKTIEFDLLRASLVSPGLQPLQLLGFYKGFIRIIVIAMYSLKKKQIVAPYSDWLSRAELKNDIVHFTQDKYIDPATHILHGISILVPMPFVMVNESGNILYAAISYSGLLGCMGAWVLQCFSIELQATPNQNFKLNMEVWKMILPNFKGVSNFQVPSQIFGVDYMNAQATLGISR